MSVRARREAYRNISRKTTRCLDACVKDNSKWKGFILNSDGDCWCEGESSSNCERQNMEVKDMRQGHDFNIL